jgi:pimeloyl-ACP methyl ester carboxylesterase
VVFKLLRFLRPLTKILGLGNKIEQVRQQRQVVLQSPAACKLLFQRRQSEIDAELLQEKLPCLKIPVLILQGGVDTSTASSLSHAYADLIPTAELKIISQGGNDLPQSFPDAVAQHIRDFVKAERMSEK